MALFATAAACPHARYTLLQRGELNLHTSARGLSPMGYALSHG
jgi:hypothetical protein